MEMNNNSKYKDAQQEWKETIDAATQEIESVKIALFERMKLSNSKKNSNAMKMLKYEQHYNILQEQINRIQNEEEQIKMKNREMQFKYIEKKFDLKQYIENVIQSLTRITNLDFDYDDDKMWQQFAEFEMEQAKIKSEFANALKEYEILKQNRMTKNQSNLKEALKGCEKYLKKKKEIYEKLHAIKKQLKQ